MVGRGRERKQTSQALFGFDLRGKALSIAGRSRSLPAGGRKAALSLPFSPQPAEAEAEAEAFLSEAETPALPCPSSPFLRFHLIAVNMLIEGSSSPRKTVTVPVYLNVYDITSMNGCAFYLGLGIYHSGVQVYDVEYAFGAHDYSTTGIFEVEPKECPGFTFRKSILIGWTSLSPNEVMLLMEEMAGEYTGDTYHLITRNCNHFCNDACVSLTGNRIPRWVNRLAKFGLLFNCVFPTNVHPEKVRCRSEDSISGIERKKLRDNSIKFVTSPPNDTYITAKAITRSRRRCTSLSAPPLLATSSIMNLEQLLCQA